jgi:hypothetical protein
MHYLPQRTAHPLPVSPRKGGSMRYQSKVTIGGLPFISIDFGPDPQRNEFRGVARGVIAIGDVALGFLALGGFSIGVISIGGFGIGVISLGGLSIGLLASLGGFSIGWLAYGGLAIGYRAFAGLAIGAYPQGGTVIRWPF